MKKITNNNINPFKRLKIAKEKFCLKVIIRLDKIITFCSTKKLIKEVEGNQNELKEFKQFSHKFEENKEILKVNIENILKDNKSMKDDLQYLHWCYMNGKIIQMEVVFNKYNFHENKEKIVK